MASGANNDVLRFRVALLAGLAAALGACVLWVYWPALAIMARRWRVDAQYSHGFLVPVFAVALLWLRRGLYKPGQAHTQWWGVPVLGIALGMYLYGSYVYKQWYEAISLVPCLAGLCLLLGGWTLLRWTWPSIAFLAFMMPLPYSVEVKFCEQLQYFATATATYGLQTLGFPAFHEGTDIVLNNKWTGVEKACSGLSMLMTFFALSTAVALLVRRPAWERLVIVVSAIPIAVASNVTRVAGTVLLYQATDNEWLQQKAHDSAGWMMMILGLLLLAVELKYLSYLAPESGRSGPDPLKKPSLPRPVQPALSRENHGPRPRWAAGTA
jgi:exosortase